jgi:hypothetical protein
MPAREFVHRPFIGPAVRPGRIRIPMTTRRPTRPKARIPVTGDAMFIPNITTETLSSIADTKKKF